MPARLVGVQSSDGQDLGGSFIFDCGAPTVGIVLGGRLLVGGGAVPACSKGSADWQQLRAC